MELGGASGPSAYDPLKQSEEPQTPAVVLISGSKWGPRAKTETHLGNFPRSRISSHVKACLPIPAVARALQPRRLWGKAALPTNSAT